MKAINATTRISFNNILLATDFSPVSETALRYAIGLARRYGAKIFATHVVSAAEAPMVPPEAWGSCQQILDEAAHREMKWLTERLGTIPHETTLRHGGVWDSLSAMIEKDDIDLLVMGTHGREGLGRLLLGSVAEEVFRRAACPVLTVGPNVAVGSEAEPRFRQIVYATDFGAQSLAAAPYAISLAQDYQARLTLLHVGVSVAGLVDADRMVEQWTKDLRALVPADVEPWCQVEYLVEFGDPAQHILELAEQRKAELVVLGVRPAPGHLGAGMRFGAATAHAVVSMSHCPVLSVRG